MTDPTDPPTPEPEESTPPAAETPATEAAAPKKPARPRRAPAKKPASAGESPAPKPKAPKETPPPRRPKLPAELARLLAHRQAQDRHRPRFTRQQSYRYWRIGRDGAWRKPRGLQSKQRRHYGYRSTIVSIGFRSPRRIRGVTPTGFRPILVRTTEEINRINPAQEAAVIARTVGTRRRLVLEEAARKRGIHVLNPLTKEVRET